MALIARRKSKENEKIDENDISPEKSHGVIISNFHEDF